LTFLLNAAILLWEFFENGRANGGDEGSPECLYRLQLGSAVFCAASLAINPLFGPTTDVLINMGASDAVRTVAEGEVWRVITPMYLHGGLVHFGLNMLAFSKFGTDLERSHGFVRVAIIYLLSGIFGILMGVALSPHVVKVGASGAIFGLLGALLGEVLQNWGLYSRPWATVLPILLGTVLQLLLGTMPTLDNFSHLFGFIMGFLCSLLLLVMKRQTAGGKLLATRCHQRLFQVTAGVCIVVCFAVAIAVIYGPLEAGQICPRCDMISCIPFPWGCDSDREGSCWAWDCSETRVAGCQGSATWTGSARNGTVTLGCPVGITALRDVEVRPVDLSHWGSSDLMRLCKDHCP